jgi:hypothetical protein
MANKRIEIDLEDFEKIEEQCKIYKISKKEMIKQMLFNWYEKQLKLFNEEMSEDCGEINDEFWS